MGFFDLAITFIVKVSKLTSNFALPVGYDDLQKPFQFVEDTVKSVFSETPGVQGLLLHPEGSRPDFMCHYPELDPSMWEACNEAESRDCWIRRTDGTDRKDILTNCTYPDQGQEHVI